MVKAPDQSCLRSGRLRSAARRAARIIAGVWLVLSLRVLVAIERRSTGGLRAPYVRDAPYRLPLRIYGGSGLKHKLGYGCLLVSYRTLAPRFPATGFALPARRKFVRRYKMVSSQCQTSLRLTTKHPRGREKFRNQNTSIVTLI